MIFYVAEEGLGTASVMTRRKLGLVNEGNTPGRMEGKEPALQ